MGPNGWKWNLKWLEMGLNGWKWNLNGWKWNLIWLEMGLDLKTLEPKPSGFESDLTQISKP